MKVNDRTEEIEIDGFRKERKKWVKLNDRSEEIDLDRLRKQEKSMKVND
jgi:hypothetical protein